MSGSVEGELATEKVRRTLEKARNSPVHGPRIHFLSQRIDEYVWAKRYSDEEELRGDIS